MQVDVLDPCSIWTAKVLTELGFVSATRAARRGPFVRDGDGIPSQVLHRKRVFD